RCAGPRAGRRGDRERDGYGHRDGGVRRDADPRRFAGRGDRDAAVATDHGDDQAESFPSVRLQRDPHPRLPRGVVPVAPGPATFAPYPAFAIAAMSWSVVAASSLKSTSASPAERSTTAEYTPPAPINAFSTFIWQCGHVIPVTRSFNVAIRPPRAGA